MKNLDPAKRGARNRIDYEGLASKLTDPSTGYGFSHPVTASGGTPKTGVMVAREGTEKVIPGVASAADIEAYATEHAEHLEAHPHTYIGGWVQEGKTYLDISQRFPKARQQAEHAQSANDQIAGWDVAKGKEVPTVPALPGILEPNVDPVHPEDRRASAAKSRYHPRDPYNYDIP